MTLVLLVSAPATASSHREAPILFSGTPLSNPHDLRRLVVEQTLNDVATAEIELFGGRGRALSPPAGIGATLEIHSDEDPATPPLFMGEVVGIEPVFTSGGQSTLRIVGHDRLHRLRRGRSTRTFPAGRDGDLVAATAAAHGLGHASVDPGFAFDHVFQRNQSDLEFLRSRAARIGWLLRVEDETLRFEPPPAAPSLALSFGEGLRSFQPSLTVAAQVEKVVVRGWNPTTKEPIVGEAGAHDAPPEATAVFDRADPLSEEPLLAEGQLFSAPEAALVAQAALAMAAGEARQGAGVADGDPRIRAGAVVELQGVGGRFDGSYFVTRATHVIEPSGYTTAFEVRSISLPER